MKHIMKLIALLLAGVMLVSMAACDSQTTSLDDEDGMDRVEDQDKTGDKDDESDDKVIEKDSSEVYKELSPSALYDALLNAEDVVLTVYVSGEKGTPYYIEKDGDVFKCNMANFNISYVDLSNECTYGLRGAEDHWVKYPTAAFTWEEMIKASTYGTGWTAILSDDYFEPFDSETQRYVLKGEIVGDEETDALGYISRYGSTYRIAISGTEGDEQNYVIITIDFTSVILCLPENYSEEGSI